MKTVSCACLVAAAFVLADLQVTAAQTAKFRHMVSIYSDELGAGLKLPEGVACGAAGQIVIGDTGNNRLVRFTFRDEATTGGSVIEIPELSAPSQLQLNSTGDIFALSGKQRRIVHLGPDGEFKEVLKFDGVPAPTTVVPRAFALDSADNIYVLDVFSSRVLMLDSQGTFRRALPFPTGIGFGSGLAVDAAGGLLLLDSVKRQLFSAAPDATAFVPFGADLSATLTTLPTSITTSQGTTFVAVGNGSSIVSLGQDGVFVARQLALGQEEGALNYPSQMCVNDRDEVFIADRDNSRIQVFQLIR